MTQHAGADDIVLAVAGAALLVACALALALHVAVVAAWARRRARARRERKAEQVWGRLFALAAAGADGVDVRRAVRRREAGVVLELWISRRDAVAHDGGLVVLARQIGLDGQARRLARRGRGRAHMAGVVALGWLGDSADVELLERIVLRGREPMASAALASLVRLDAPPAFRVVRRWLRTGAQPLPAVVSTAVVQAPKGALAALVRQEAQGRAFEAPGLLRIIGLRRDHQGIGAVRAVLAQRDAPPEALAAALQALTDIGRPTDVVLACRLLTHESWAVRVRAVHAVTHLGGHAYTKRLVPLLDDPDPWVRRRAAEAVAGDPAIDLDTERASERARLAIEEALITRGALA